MLGTREHCANDSDGGSKTWGGGATLLRSLPIKNSDLLSLCAPSGLHHLLWRRPARGRHQRCTAGHGALAGPGSGNGWCCSWRGGGSTTCPRRLCRPDHYRRQWPQARPPRRLQLRRHLRRAGRLHQRRGLLIPLPDYPVRVPSGRHHAAFGHVLEPGRLAYSGQHFQRRARPCGHLAVGRFLIFLLFGSRYPGHGYDGG